MRKIKENNEIELNCRNCKTKLGIEMSDIWFKKFVTPTHIRMEYTIKCLNCHTDIRIHKIPEKWQKEIEKAYIYKKIEI